MVSLLCDFIPKLQLFLKHSVGGCYPFPSGFLLYRRKTASFIGTISLAMLGLSTNKVLDILTPEIMICTVKRCEWCDAVSVKYISFMKLCRFVGDSWFSSGHRPKEAHGQWSMYTLQFQTETLLKRLWVPLYYRISLRQYVLWEHEQLCCGSFFKF